MTCEYCGIKLNRKKRFCSDTCRHSWWREHPGQRKQYFLTCRECLTLFQTYRKNALFCSHLCRNRGNSRSHARILANETKHITWGCGGGVDSIAIAALIVLGVLPKPDVAYMVNAGFEKERTWDHVYGTLIPKLRGVGVELHIIKSPNATITKNGKLQIPAYKKTKDGVSKYTNRCGSWKKPVAMKWLKENGVRSCVNWVGIATEEARRRRMSNSLWFQVAYPLLQLNISRSDCKSIISRIGWPKPPRTSCYMCPNQHDADWMNMKYKYPVDWEKAVAVDKFINNEYGMFLHGDCVLLDRVDFEGDGQQGDPDIERFFDGSLRHVGIEGIPRIGYIYGYESPNGDEIRIGHAGNPTARIKEHQQKYGEPIKNRWRVRAGQENETMLHRELKQYVKSKNKSFYKNTQKVYDIIDKYFDFETEGENIRKW